MKKKKPEKKNDFRFGEIFDKSIQEYKGNFKDIFKFIFLLVGIPALLLTIAQIIFLISDPTLFSIMSTPELLAQVDAGTLQLPIYYNIVTFIFNLIAVFLSVLVTAGLLSTSLKKSKFSFNELMINGKSKYWRFFLFSIVVGIFVFLLTLLLIIPGIIFAVYWAFAACFFFDKKTKIRESLKQSKAIVKNRWWRTLGYFVLFGLILLGMILVASMINLPVLIITMLHILDGSQLSMGLLIVSSILGFIYNLLISLATPLSILFLKNFYLKMKK